METKSATDAVTLRCRVAGRRDIPALVHLVDSAYRGESSRDGWTTEADLLAGQRTDASLLDAILADPTSRVLLAEGPRELVGCCHVKNEGGGQAYFGMFAVMPARQGAGIGGSLLREAENAAVREWEVTTMRMTVIRQRQDLIRWYATRGYCWNGRTEPFPYGDERFGLPLRADLEFAVLVKQIAS